LHFANRLRACACYQRDMRSVWSTLVAVTLVVAGARVGAAPAGHPGHRELHAAKCLRIAPTVRRAQQPVRPLDTLVTVAAVELPAASRHLLAADRSYESAQPAMRPLIVRVARGPPRA